MNDVCKACGGSVIRKGNTFVCEWCGNRWTADASDDVHAVDRAEAWRALRKNDFEKAAASFEDILEKEPWNHEAYWGRALALNGIVYVTDLNENKKIPTCNNITDQSFLQDGDVQKAIALADKEIADNYRSQAESIERIRKEWFEKASHEPSYDVFLSYKDSDSEHNIVRTQDSIDAQDLYNALTAEGFRVFFSRISLRDKVAEQYEPYIFNAISTAKVMIVFGEKPEYFRAPWIKNEWMRFKSRIEKGDKHKNSLVVVYKDMNPNELPAVLRTRQCLNAADMTFLTDLTRHIRKICDLSKQNIGLERINIQGGLTAKKAASLNNKTIEIRQTGLGAIADITISEKQTLSLIETYLNARSWAEAIRLAEDLLFDNPANARAIWYHLLGKLQIPASAGYCEVAKKLKPKQLPVIDKILNCAAPDFANKLLHGLYQCGNSVSSSFYAEVLQIILPYSVEDREACIANAFACSVQHHKYESFLLLLSTLGNKDVDSYIQWNMDYAASAILPNEKIECWKRVLEIDPGMLQARRNLLQAVLPQQDFDRTVKDFETLLQYTDDIPKEVQHYLDVCAQIAPSSRTADFANQLVRYYPGQLSKISSKIIAVGFKLLEGKLFGQAEKLFTLVLTEDADAARAYLGKCLCVAQVTREEDIPYCDADLSSIPEFNKYMVLVSEDQRKYCIDLLNKQKQNQKEKFRKEIQAKKEKIDRKRSNVQSQLDDYKEKFNKVQSTNVSVVVAAFCTAVGTFFMSPSLLGAGLGAGLDSFAVICAVIGLAMILMGLYLLFTEESKRITLEREIEKCKSRLELYDRKIAVLNHASCYSKAEAQINALNDQLSAIPGKADPLTASDIMGILRSMGVALLIGIGVGVMAVLIMVASVS